MLSDCFDSAVRFDGSLQDLQQRSSDIPSGRGVLLFADADDRPIQLLAATNLRRTARSRLLTLQTEKPSRRARLSEIARTIYFRSACCEFQVQWDLLRIARYLFADSYRDRILLPNLHLIQIDRTVPWPRYTYTSRVDFHAVSSHRLSVFGPYHDRKGSMQMMDIQTRAFDLCRKLNLIDSPDRAQTCPYLQMAECPAPCVGRISRDEYLFSLDAAADLVAGRFDLVLSGLEDRMRDEARALRFEVANRLKRVIEDINKIRTAGARWTADLSELTVLHIDRSAKVAKPGSKKIQCFAAYVFRRGQILRLPDFILDQIPSVVESLSWFDSGQVRTPFVSDVLSRLEIATPPGLLTDQFALVAFFVFRKSPPGLWLSCGRSLPEPEQIYKSLSSF